METLTLTRQRCWTHPAREAAARCPSCTRFFCRECVTEHEGRLLCVACLRLALERPAASRGSSRKVAVVVGRTAQLTAGLAIGWLFFYLLGQALLATPSAFHEGTLWLDHIMPGGGEGD